MKKIITPLVIFAVLLSAKAQDSTVIPKTFFSSNITFTDKNLISFYSSFTIDNDRVIFNANNYKIYSYNKLTGTENWEVDVNLKTNKPPFFYGSSVIVGNYTNKKQNNLQLELNSGKIIQPLSMEPLYTKPFFKDSIMYCTAIYDEEGGQIMAYDLKANAIIWKKFIAHGVDAQPYFLKDKIIANAEADNWFEINYKGQLLDTTCKKKAELFVQDIKCVRNFKFLTHDDYELTEEFIEKQFGSNAEVKMKYAKDLTIILGAEKMLIIDNKKKIKKSIEIVNIIGLPEPGDNEYTEILKVENNTIWFFYKNSLAVYDFEKNKTIQEYNLNKWNAYQIMLDESNIWLISKNDGQLYGMKL